MMDELRDRAIEEHCRELKMPGMATEYDHLLREGEHPKDYLLDCLEAESRSKLERKLKFLTRNAKLPYTRTLAGFDFLRAPDIRKDQILELGNGGFLKKGENLILLGKSGTGKTHIAIGVAMACIAQGYSVRFTTAMGLAQELLVANDEHRLKKALARYEKCDLVVVDELGYLGLGPGGPMLFQFFAERYERRSVCVTTNLEFRRWTEIFSDTTMTEAMLDRLTHHAHIFVFKGESYRFAQRVADVRSEN